jgi:hypothetical protein
MSHAHVLESVSVALARPVDCCGAVAWDAGIATVLVRDGLAVTDAPGKQLGHCQPARGVTGRAGRCCQGHEHTGKEGSACE